MAELSFRKWSGWYLGRGDSQPRPMHSAAAAMQNAAGRRPRLTCVTYARLPPAVSHEPLVGSVA